jgi:hypothetical protein
MRTVVAAALLAVVLVGCRQAKPSVLDGHVAMPDPQHLLVQGDTSLPDKAQILISLQDGKDRSVVAQGLPLVKDGRFQALINLPKELPAGTHQVRLTFSPASYDWSQGRVLQEVGKKGEHLSGVWAKKDGDLTILQREYPLTITANKGMKP